MNDLSVRPLWIAFVLAAFAVIAGAQTKGPLISASDSGWNFGEVNEGDLKDHEITLTNNGDQPLEIKKIDVTCGCVEAKMFDTWIAPGKSLPLKLHLDSRRGGHGEIKKQVILTTNSAQTPKFELQMEGVIKPVWWLKDINVNLGTMPNGVVNEKKLRIYTAPGRTIKLLNVQTNPTDFAIVDRKEVKDPDGTGGWELTIRLPKNWESGVFEALCLMTTDFAPIPERACRLFGEFVGGITLSPSDLAFGPMKPGESKTMKVKVQKAQGEGMEIVQVDAKDENLKTSFKDIEKGKSAEIELTYTAPTKEGTFRGEVQVVINEPGQRVHTITYYGRVAP